MRLIMLTEEEIKKRIADAGDTIPKAAEKLGMSKQNLYNHLAKNPISASFIRQFNEFYPKSSKVDRVEEEGVPYYPLDVSASNVDVFTDEAEVSEMKVVVPGFEDCEVALPVFGHSMYPTYESGSIIICKRILDLDVIQYGEAHLIVTGEQRFLKRLKPNKDEDKITLCSDNFDAKNEEKRRYEDFAIRKDKIKHLFIVKGSIKRNQI